MDKKSLTNFVKVCREIRVIAEPCLYKTISLTPSATAYREVLKLLGSIRERPRIVSRTETLKIAEPERDTSDVMELVQIAGLSTQPTANQSISYLLSKLPNLRSFSLHAFNINSVDNEPLNFSSSKRLVTLQLPAHCLLITLQLPAHCLLICLSPTPVLPSTLERLDVNEVDWVDGERLSELLIEYVKRKPVEGADAWALKSISMDAKRTYWRSKEDKMRAICNGKGVKLELSELYPGRDPWGY
ncbi:hypothetical protein I7I51_05231 [Histoplasma capsulatum]|uniref:Uncharacterized protein n=2 Tax=Histoplasma TaxID=5036 RepID=A0A8A1M7H9_AJECA|nr:hypothetical protein I7I51_05231 [Histoplasma capsulatum]